MYKGTWGYSAVACAIYLAGASAYAIDIALTYQRYQETPAGSDSAGNTGVKLSVSHPPDGLVKLPELKGKYPLYTLLEVGDSKRFVVLARQNEKDEFYNRLYVDGNGNRDLTDDKVIDAEFEKREESGTVQYVTTFPPVELAPKQGSDAKPEVVRIKVVTAPLLSFSSIRLKDESLDRVLTCTCESSSSAQGAAIDFKPFGHNSVSLCTRPPAGSFKLPALKGSVPLYGLVHLGDPAQNTTPRLLILARDDEDKTYSRLYFDTNGNNDLTDDKPVEGSSNSFESGSTPVVHGYTVFFPPIDTTVEIHGKSLPYSFTSTFSVNDARDLDAGKLTGANLGNAFLFSLSVNCCYTGRFESAGKAYFVTLGDGNGNAMFGDVLSRSAISLGSATRVPMGFGGDQIYLSEGTATDYDAMFSCGDLLLVDGTLYEVAVDVSAGKMTLTPTTQPLVALSLPAETERLCIYSEEGRHCVMMFRAGKTAQVPKGTYRLAHYQILRKDPQGDLWRLSASASSESPPIVVDGGKNASLTFGEPYTPLAEVPEYVVKAVRAGKEEAAALDFKLMGVGKELVSQLTHVSGSWTKIVRSEQQSNRSKEPTYKVVKNDGEVVVQGSFEYG